MMYVWTISGRLWQLQQMQFIQKPKEVNRMAHIEFPVMAVDVWGQFQSKQQLDSPNLVLLIQTTHVRPHSLACSGDNALVNSEWVFAGPCDDASVNSSWPRPTYALSGPYGQCLRLEALYPAVYSSLIRQWRLRFNLTTSSGENDVIIALAFTCDIRYNE